MPNPYIDESDPRMQFQAQMSGLSGVMPRAMSEYFSRQYSNLYGEYLGDYMGKIAAYRKQQQENEEMQGTFTPGTGEQTLVKPAFDFGAFLARYPYEQKYYGNAPWQRGERPSILTPPTRWIR